MKWVALLRPSTWEAPLRDASKLHPIFRDLHLLALVRGGRLDEARRMAGPWTEQVAAPRDYMWSTATTARSWLWRAFDDRQAMDALRRDLTPYADRLVVPSATGTFLGSLHLWVGELAAAIGDVTAARQHLRAAEQTHERLGLPWWVERTRRRLAAMG